MRGTRADSTRGTLSRCLIVRYDNNGVFRMSDSIVLSLLCQRVFGVRGKRKNRVRKQGLNTSPTIFLHLHNVQFHLLLCDSFYSALTKRKNLKKKEKSVWSTWLDSRPAMLAKYLVPFIN